MAEGEGNSLIQGACKSRQNPSANGANCQRGAKERGKSRKNVFDRKKDERGGRSWKGPLKEKREKCKTQRGREKVHQREGEKGSSCTRDQTDLWEGIKKRGKKTAAGEGRGRRFERKKGGVGKVRGKGDLREKERRHLQTGCVIRENIASLS